MDLNHTDQNVLPLKTPTLKERRRKTCRKQKNIKTPEEAAARRLLKNEKRKKLRALKLLFETPEERAIRRLKVAKQVREYLRKQRALETPEKTAERQLAKNEANKTRRKLETPEEKTARRIKAAENLRKYRQKQKALETPEKAAERQLAKKEANKILRKKEAEQIKLKSPEEKAARRIKLTEQGRKYRQRQKALETPEQAAIRRAKASESTRRWMKRASERKRQAKQVIPETPEEKAARHLQDSTEIKIEKLEWSVFESTETNFVTQEAFRSQSDIDSLLDGSTTREKLQDAKTYNQQSERHERQKQMAEKADKTDEDSPVLCEMLDFIKMYLDTEVRRDEYFVYGEYVATRLRNCNREEPEINTAKRLVEDILYCLNAGVYCCATSSGVDTQIKDSMNLVHNVGVEKCPSSKI